MSVSASTFVLDMIGLHHRLFHCSYDQMRQLPPWNGASCVSNSVAKGGRLCSFDPTPWRSTTVFLVLTIFTFSPFQPTMPKWCCCLPLWFGLVESSPFLARVGLELACQHKLVGSRDDWHGIKLLSQVGTRLDFLFSPLPHQGRTSLPVGARSSFLFSLWPQQDQTSLPSRLD